MQNDYNQKINLVQINLTPDLLKGRWKEQTHPLEGHCYVAAEALYHIIDKENFDVYYAAYQDENGRATHWWLKRKDSELILDPTKEQYSFFNLQPPYHLGKRGMFLTSKPSKRAMQIIAKINATSIENK